MAIYASYNYQTVFGLTAPNSLIILHIEQYSAYIHYLITETMAESGTKESKDPKEIQSSGKKNIRQNLEKYLPIQRKPSLSLKSVSSEETNQVASTKPAQKQRQVSSTGEGENSEIENVRGALPAIQETLKTIVSKDDIRDVVKSVVEELKEETKQKLKITIKEEIMRDLRTEIGELKTQKKQQNCVKSQRSGHSFQTKWTCLSWTMKQNGGQNRETKKLDLKNGKSDQGN
jgi:hypothetical protein